jgi:hypothetical protein
MGGAGGYPPSVHASNSPAGQTHGQYEDSDYSKYLSQNQQSGNWNSNFYSTASGSTGSGSTTGSSPGAQQGSSSSVGKPGMCRFLSERPSSSLPSHLLTYVQHNHSHLHPQQPRRVERATTTSTAAHTAPNHPSTKTWDNSQGHSTNNITLCNNTYHKTWYQATNLVRILKNILNKEKDIGSFHLIKIDITTAPNHFPTPQFRVRVEEHNAHTTLTYRSMYIRYRVNYYYKSTKKEYQVNYIKFFMVSRKFRFVKIRNLKNRTALALLLCASNSAT